MLLRKIIVLAAAVLVLLSGCVGNQKAPEYTPPLDRAFEMTAIVRQDEREFLVKFCRQPQGSAQVRFEGPDVLKGLEMHFDAESVTVAYEGLSFAFLPDGFPGQAAIKQVLDSFSAALDGETECEKTDQGMLVKGSLAGESFALLLDRQTGKILKLEIPESGLELKPLNFEFL